MLQILETSLNGTVRSGASASCSVSGGAEFSLSSCAKRSADIGRLGDVTEVLPSAEVLALGASRKGFLRPEETGLRLPPRCGHSPAVNEARHQVAPALVLKRSWLPSLSPWAFCAFP